MRSGNVSIKLSYSLHRVFPQLVAHVFLCRFAIPFACYEARRFESAAVRWLCSDNDASCTESCWDIRLFARGLDRSCVLVCGVGTNGPLCKREFRSSRSRRSTRFRWLLFYHDYALPFRVTRSFVPHCENQRAALYTHIGVHSWQAKQDTRCLTKGRGWMTVEGCKMKEGAIRAAQSRPQAFTSRLLPSYFDKLIEAFTTHFVFY